MQEVPFASVFFRPKVGPRSKQYELDETQYLEWYSLTPRNLTQSYCMNGKSYQISKVIFTKILRLIYKHMMEINQKPQRLKSVRLLQYFSISWKKLYM